MERLTSATPEIISNAEIELDSGHPVHEFLKGSRILVRLKRRDLVG